MQAMPASPHRAVPWCILLAGISAALHLGKLPPALPALQEALGLTLVQAGFLLSLIQVAGMALGLVAGLLADGWGQRRCMLTGLWLLSAASLAGAAVPALAQAAVGVQLLMVLRAVEGAGFLLVTVSAPSLLRRSVQAAQLTRTLGLWGGFMPFGTAAALLLGPAVIHGLGWPAWWCSAAVFSALMGAAVWAMVPPDAPPATPATPAPPATPATKPVAARPPASAWSARLWQTLGAPGPWLGALSFAMYSAQWLAVIGFLPALYAQAGWSGLGGAVLTALVALVNVVGNVLSGRCLHAGVRPGVLLCIGFCGMACGGWLAYASATEGLAWLRYGGALLFSAVGGLIPGTLFALAARLAPNEQTIATTVGLMMQCSSIGQFSGPPLVAWLAASVGGWHLSWAVLMLCCAVGVTLAMLVQRRIERR